MTLSPLLQHAFRSAGRTALLLLAFTLVFSALMAGTYQWTQPYIARSQAATQMRLLNDILPPQDYNNALLDDVIPLPAVPALHLKSGAKVYRARRNLVPVALVIESVAPDGYGGAIRLLVAVDTQQRILGVRVVEHHETPGLGDYIDPRKDRRHTPPWITQFNGAGFATIPEKNWQVRRDGGHFDFMAGATISARAVIRAAARTLRFSKAHQAVLFSTPRGQRPRLTGISAQESAS